MGLDLDQLPGLGRASQRPSAATFALGAAIPLALVWSMGRIAGEHAHQFLFVPVLAIALVSLLWGTAVGAMGSVLSTGGLIYLAASADPRAVSAFELVRLGGVGVVSLLVAWTTGALRAAYGRAAEERAAAVRAAAQLRVEKARAERAVELRDEVLSVVSHDLRNPLATISVTADLLERRCDRDAPALSRHARTVRKTVSEMNRLIGDLLDAARLEAGKLSLAPRAVQAGDVGRDAVERFTPLAAAADVALELRAAEELPEVECDPERILQVLSNLIGNALKVTPAGGSITVAIEPVADAVRFTVSDTGRGIDPDDLPHLFERFRRGRAPGYEGTGLGLAIVRGIVEAHGGRVSVESAPGQGARFSFALPRARPTAAAGPSGEARRDVEPRAAQPG